MDRRHPVGTDRGLVTAELAVCLPVLLLVLSGCLWAVAAVGAQLRCLDAAHLAARAVARGEPVASAERVARAAAPEGARVEVDVQGEDVVARVSVRAPGPTVLPALAGVDVAASAVAALEPAARANP